ncbi:MAG: flagellar biosynthetic protein FliO, partial [Planctomycetota bacterium]
QHRHTGPSMTRVVLSLAGVAVLIVGLGFVYRKMVAGQQAKGGAVTMVSRSVLTPKHQVMVLRVGHRLVVVGDAGQGMQPLCEITDPGEIAAVVGAAGGDLDELQAGAFAASLDNASAGYDPIPDGDDEPVEEAPGSTMFDDAGKEVQGLLDRVRGLTRQVQNGQSDR